MTTAVIAPTARLTSPAPATRWETRDVSTAARRHPAASLGRGLATAARFAGHFVVACASVAVLGAEADH